MSDTLNVFQPSLDDDEAEAVRQVMKTNWIGRGKRCEEFEQKFAAHLGVKAENMLSITSCTDGLFLAMDLLGIEPSDMVIMPAISFIGAANAVAARGARPIFCDVDERSLNVTAQDIADALDHYPYTRKSRFRAVILLHYGGYPCEDMDNIIDLCNERNVTIVEDSACSVSSKIGDQACGTIGRIGTWSFDAMKILSTGDGGMLYTEYPVDRIRATKRAFLGMTTTSGMASDPSSPWWGVDIDVPGRRCVMNDINAAIGLVQLEKLPDFIEARKCLHQRYVDQLKDIEWIMLPPELPDEFKSSYYFFWIQMPSERSRNALASFLRARQIYTTFRYYPLHRVRWYAEHFSQPQLPRAERAAAVTLNLPLHQTMSLNEVDRVCDGIRDFMDAGGLK